MCTIKEVKEAIRENCQSQYEMESAEIDRIFQTLPFSQVKGRCFGSTQEDMGNFERHNLFNRIVAFFMP